MITLQEVEAALAGSEYSVIRHRGERTRYVFIGDRHEQNHELTTDFMRKTRSRISAIFLEGAQGIVEHRKNGFRLAMRLFSFPFESYYWCPNQLIRDLLRTDPHFFRSFLEQGGRIKCNDHEGLLKKQVESARAFRLEVYFRHFNTSNDHEEEEKSLQIAHERSKKMLKALLRDRGTLILQVVGARHLDDFWHSHFTDFITIGRPEDFTWAAETENAAH